MSKKPIIFLSHIHEEKDLAKKIKELIENTFMKRPTVFVSSDASTNQAGDDWLDNIKYNIHKDRCVIGIILCSKNSVTKPWINVEYGALWIQGIRTIPLCHSDMTKGNLPVPLNSHNALELNADDINSLINAIGNELDMEVQASDFSNFIKSTTIYQKKI